MSISDRPIVAIGLTVTGILILLLSMYLVAGCGGSTKEEVKPPVAPPIRVVTVVTNCLPKPPPEELDVDKFGFVREGCPDHFGGCVTEDALRALILYLSDLQLYAKDAWSQCGPIAKPIEELP